MSYWSNRMLEAQKKWTDKGIDEINEQLKKYYKKVMQTTINDFEAVYNKVLLAVEDGKQVTPADLYKLDTYYQMQGQLKDRLQKLGDKTCAAMSVEFEREYKHIYSALAIDDNGQAIKATASDVAWSTIDEQAAKQVANQIWCADGKSWSQRVWNNMDELQQTLNDSLIDCVVGGKKTTELKKTLMEKFNVNYRRAETLVRTEMAHIETQAARDRYKNYGIDKVKVLVDTDSRTCDVCAKLEGKEFDINAKMPIPVHPNCRCCIVPVVDKSNNRQIDYYKCSYCGSIRKPDVEYCPNCGKKRKEIIYKKSENQVVQEQKPESIKRTCQRCGKTFKGTTTYCKSCRDILDKRQLDSITKFGYEYNAKKDELYSTDKSRATINYNYDKSNDNLMYYCIDCGKPFYTNSKKSVAQKRCPECQAKYRKKYKAQKEKERRAKKKNK